MGHPYLVLWIGLTVAVSTFGVVADTSDENDYQVFKRKALSAIESEYRQLIRSYGDKQELSAFQERVRVLDEIVSAISNELEALRTHNDYEVQPKDSKDEAHFEKSGNVVTPTGAAALFAAYEERFAKPLPIPPLAEAELQVLRDYYRKAAQAAEQFVSLQCQRAISQDGIVGDDVAPYHVIIPFLHAPDQAWSDNEFASLPEWACQPGCLRALEQFAFALGRTWTSFCFAHYGKKTNANEAYIEYLREHASRVTELEQYHLRVRYLREAIRVSESIKIMERAAELRRELASGLEAMGHPSEAAQVIQPIITAGPESARPEAAVLRLMYLFQAGHFQDISQEFRGYENLAHVEAHLPHILYIGWAALSQQKMSLDAEAAQREFLKKFEHHPLAANMHFASALAAISAGEYAEARRVLEMIEVQFPQSNLLGRIKKIRKQIDKVR